VITQGLQRQAAMRQGVPRRVTEINYAQRVNGVEQICTATGLARLAPCAWRFIQRPMSTR
jgi:hypothetical protein